MHSPMKGCAFFMLRFMFCATFLVQNIGHRHGGGTWPLISRTNIHHMLPATLRLHETVCFKSEMCASAAAEKLQFTLISCHRKYQWHMGAAAEVMKILLQINFNLYWTQRCVSGNLPYILAYNAIARITRPPYFELKTVPRMHFSRITRPANFGRCPSAVQVKYPEI